MTLDDLLEATNDLLRDASSKALYSDDEKVRGLNEGQNLLATRLHEFVTASRQLNLEAGIDSYPLDEDIIMVYSVMLDGYYGRLTQSTECWTPEGLSLSRPSRYTTDRETQTIRFYQIPDQQYTAILRCARLPTPLSLDSSGVECEVRAHRQLALCDWAAYRCFSTDDADGRNDLAAKLALERFNRKVNEAKTENYQGAIGKSPRVRGDRIK